MLIFWPNKYEAFLEFFIYHFFNYSDFHRGVKQYSVKYNSTKQHESEFDRRIIRTINICKLIGIHWTTWTNRISEFIGIPWAIGKFWTSRVIRTSSNQTCCCSLSSGRKGYLLLPDATNQGCRLRFEGGNGPKWARHATRGKQRLKPQLERK